jgi:hypothetical protein
MSLRNLDLVDIDGYKTGHNGEDYWGDYQEDEHDFVCGFCRSGAHSWCKGKQCNCPGRYGRTAPTHGPYLGPVKLVKDEADGG